MDSAEKFRKILDSKIPEPAIAYCEKIWVETPFAFHVTRERKTKLGDFRFRPDKKFQTITINGNLNPYQFLLTFIHEVAHLRAFEDFGRNIKPHGPEWKKTFRSLISPLLNPSIFPQNILVPLRKHMQNPKASSAGDIWLMKEMAKYDVDRDVEKSFLADLPLGSSFELSGRRFRKESVRRTRALCLELSSRRKFYVNLLAKVKPD
ncbi:SprT-like domain-containing protein [Algoriphagus sediminis]|uniref:SprT-like domain-containing protein n=1 Tax=Algoriphagus sediminis TaxID=3057113 RepID=A0ABT7YFA9_9BACT|nr:SprT-like domain-containing protein [Algoriphagus sediminis]MDN3205220.1 SprT-like domain-containing protein [Algoriphagus sediminis]